VTASLTVSQDLRRQLDHLGNAFLREFLEVEIARHPSNVDALAELGQVYTQCGLWNRGLEVDQQLVQLVPESPTVHYNLACSQSLLGLVDAAFGSLERATDLGYCDYEFMERDEDLASLRDDQRFRSLLERIRTKARRG